MITDEGEKEGERERGGKRKVGEGGAEEEERGREKGEEKHADIGILHVETSVQLHVPQAHKSSLMCTYLGGH